MKYFDRKSNSFHEQSNAKYSEPTITEISPEEYDENGNLIAEAQYEEIPAVLLNPDELWLEMSDEAVEALFTQAQGESKVIVSDSNGQPVLMTLDEFKALTK